MVVVCDDSAASAALQLPSGNSTTCAEVAHAKATHENPKHHFVLQ
jgi:hypothetical protein